MTKELGSNSKPDGSLVDQKHIQIKRQSIFEAREGQNAEGGLTLVNKLRNHTSEYWYIGSMLDKSVTQKNRLAALLARGLYSSRVLVFFSSALAHSSFLFSISLEATLAF